MKQFVLLIFIICFVIDELNIIGATPKTVKKNSTDIIKNALENRLKISVKKSRIQLDEGTLYITDKNELIFTKRGKKYRSNSKFRGEFESLKAIYNTNTIKIARPIIHTHTDNDILRRQHFIAMEYLNFTHMKDSSWAELGSKLADLHLCNLNANCTKHPVTKFGFHVDTYIEYDRQRNTWTDDWITFFIEYRMDIQIERLQKEARDNPRKKKVIEEYYPQLRAMIPSLFDGIEVKPSLLHGNLWAKNVVQYGSSPALCDPASFYGHNEYDIASTIVFGIYTSDFGRAYFKKIPKGKGYDRRVTLYHLHDFLKQWNKHDGDYADLVISVFEKLISNKTEEII